MPLVAIETLNAAADTRLALWHISETVDELLLKCSTKRVFSDDVKQQYKSVSRQCEVLSVRLLLESVFCQNIMITHNDDGCPFLSNHYNVSISHTKGWAVVIVSRLKKVSVDIELISSRVLKVKDIFIRNDEYAADLLSTLIHWCTKETLYKYFPDEHLAMKNIRIDAINGDSSDGIVIAENLCSKKKIGVHYCIINNYVLTFLY